jgi:predicted ferric reductase
LAAVSFGLVAVVLTGVVDESSRARSAPGGVATFLGQETGLAGSFLLMITVLLMGRLPVVERAVGQDRLTRWHRRLGGWPLYLLALHAVLITVGYAEGAQTGVLHEAWVLLRSYPDVLAATVGFLLLVLAAGSSIRRLRRRLRYEIWWSVHLYTYLALTLAFAHQLANGEAFVGHPLAVAVWSVLWASTAGTVVVFRIGLPAWRSIRHRLVVVSVRKEGPDVISLVCRGRALDKLAVSGGQYFQWRFLVPGQWWQAHPYSLSALPRPPYLRVTMKELGDQGRVLAGLQPGTRIAIEGPYGGFTHYRRRGEGVVLVGGGVGITPLRAILEELPSEVDATVILRASSEDDLVLAGEVNSLLSGRRGRLYRMVGPRQAVRLDAATLASMVPDIARRDVYVCGPTGLSAEVAASARACGVPPTQIHQEEFSF